MTREEILVMKPGRELDALVAEKVMGQSMWFSQNGSSIPIPSFSADISAAWEVANIKCPSPFSLIKCTNGEWVVNWCNKNYECCNCDEECQSKYEIEAPTAPEVICKAALLAVMEEEE